MQRFKQFLFEGFTNPYSYEWVDILTNWTGKFITDEGREYAVIFSKIFSGHNAYNLIFVQRTTHKKLFTKSEYMDIDDRITGTGNAFRVFSTVMRMMRDFVKTQRPTTLIFSAKETSRIRLYRKFSKMIEKESNLKFVGEFKKRKYNDFIFSTKPEGFRDENF